MSMSEKLFESKQLPVSVVAHKRLAATILLTVCLLILSELIWRGVGRFSTIQRKEVDLVGYLAAGLVLATFCMRSMSWLRLTALASNLAFIEYGNLASLMPVLILHAVLLPVNAYRLLQICWASESPPTASNIARSDHSRSRLHTLTLARIAALTRTQTAPPVSAAPAQCSSAASQPAPHKVVKRKSSLAASLGLPGAASGTGVTPFF